MNRQRADNEQTFARHPERADKQTNPLRGCLSVRSWCVPDIEQTTQQTTEGTAMTDDEMKLRDHFAGLAMQAFVMKRCLFDLIPNVTIAGGDDRDRDGINNRTYGLLVEGLPDRGIEIADEAYDIADAMLAERRRHADEGQAADADRTAP